MGGPSSEHEISLETGEMVLKNLDKKKYYGFPVKIEKNGSWPISMEKLMEKTDAAFIAMHGEYGEDGQVQSLLETFKIPYTGSGPMESALAMDKQKTSVLLAQNGFQIPESISLHKNDPYPDWAISKNFRLPLVIKPINQGSSIGVSIVNKKSELKEALNKAFQHSKKVLAQKHIKGREVTCGILEINGSAVPLLPTEIKPNLGKFFDYYSKYNSNGSLEITPPDLPKKLIKKIQLTALKIHKLLGCSGMSRTDMILQGNGKLYILETNTIPGLTQTSLLPQAAEKTGIPFSKLLDIIIQSALNKHLL